MRSHTTDNMHEGATNSIEISSETDHMPSKSLRNRLASRVKTGFTKQSDSEVKAKGGHPFAYSPIREHTLTTPSKDTPQESKPFGFKERAALLRSRYHGTQDQEEGASLLKFEVERQSSSQRSSRRSSIMGTPIGSPLGSPRGEEKKDLFPEEPTEELEDPPVDMAIRVIVRKRPISKSELARGDNDCLEIQRHGIIF